MVSGRKESLRNPRRDHTILYLDNESGRVAAGITQDTSSSTHGGLVRQHAYHVLLKVLKPYDTRAMIGQAQLHCRIRLGDG